VTAGRLRQKRLVPANGSPPTDDNSSGVELALQCTGENSPDQGVMGEVILRAGIYDFDSGNAGTIGIPLGSPAPPKKARK
jgi:hypothetical protein